jgi:hypothetical protein
MGGGGVWDTYMKINFGLGPNAAWFGPGEILARADLYRCYGK